MTERSAIHTGRWIGLGILVTFVVGMTSNFKLQADLFGGDGLLVNAAAHPLQIGLIAMLDLVTGAVSIAIAAMLVAHAGRAHPALAIAYAILVAGVFAISVVEHATLLAFRTVGEYFAASGAAPGVEFDVAKKTLGGLRNGVHFLHVTAGGMSVLAFFSLLYRARLVPSPLALAGMAAALAQMFTVSRPLFGLGVIYPLLAPLALVYVATAVWLLVKGLPERVAGD